MLATQVSRSVLRPVVARAFSACPWGSESWRYDKNAFKRWCKESVAPEQTQAKRELYGYLGIAFGDVDADKDGFINAQEFDLLCEKVAALPRRFGLAPSWEKAFDGDAGVRKASRKALFDQLDSRNGPARGVIGLKQFVRWSNRHVAEKVDTIDMKSKVDFYHIEEYDQETAVKYLEHALSNPKSGAYASFYEFLLTIFIEADVESKGTISREQFGVLLQKAAHGLPGLVASDASEIFLTETFKSMDVNNEGYITFRKFVSWIVEVCKLKIEHQR